MREYLRPYYLTVALMIFAAVLAVSAETMIPLLTKSVIDGAIAHGNGRELLPLGLAAIALGTLQAGLNFYRRWSLAGAVAGMEKTIRDDVYHHLQRLDPAFHDSWQSGQLLSRATNDLSTIRRFAGFGIVFFITNVWTFLLIIALLIHMNWWLGLLTGCLFLPVTALCLRFEKKYRVLSRRYQDQTGDLATYVEEAASGIRVLKSLGRRGEAATRHLSLSRHGLPQPGGQGPAARDVLGRARHGPERRDRAAAAPRRARRQPARADPRRPGRVRDPDAAADLADRGDGLHHRHRPGGGDGGAADLRAVRHPARDRRSGRARRPAAQHPAAARG